MYTVKDMPQQISTEMAEKLAKCETATIGHFLHDVFLDREIRAVLPGKRIAGTAVTLRLAGPDSALLHYAVSIARPGDILIIDRAGDDKHACWGGVVTHAAKKAGVLAAVIDGPATDFEEIRAQEMPMWCRGPAPITTKLLGLGGGMNIPVSVGGQSVEPGDAVLCDESGVIVLKPHQVDAVAERALGMQEREIGLLAKIHAGEKLADLSGARKMVEGNLAPA
ncbi:MAG: RraA family protein [Rhodobacteraceae bacterium]|nr:RraA family protein [Paracoccaceae bacterium]